NMDACHAKIPEAPRQLNSLGIAVFNMPAITQCTSNDNENMDACHAKIPEAPRQLNSLGIAVFNMPAITQCT
ncbi:hypothetical protein, partial [Escherichia coli]|uniref:hypothetical protein n=1 Tax=Escherichia coli TaxID=562 RepID=UPI001BC8B8BD